MPPLPPPPSLLQSGQTEWSVNLIEWHGDPQKLSNSSGAPTVEEELSRQAADDARRAIEQCDADGPVVVYH